jgi:hypothetical protein
VADGIIPLASLRVSWDTELRQENKRLREENERLRRELDGADRVKRSLHSALLEADVSPAFEQLCRSLITTLEGK